jgi:hypothetical protein
MNTDKAIALIRQHGIFGLGVGDGCWCCYFQVQGIEVGISCHKSEHCIRVHANCLDEGPAGLEAVLYAIVEDSKARYDKDFSDYRVRFCDYDCDHVGGHWEGKVWTETYKCCYCGAPRSEAQKYLCEACKGKDEARRLYPWTGDYVLNCAASEDAGVL